MIPSSAPQEVKKHEKQQGEVFQKDKPKPIYRKGPSKIKTDGKESRQLSESLIWDISGNAGLGPKALVTFVELLQTLKKGQYPDLLLLSCVLFFLSLQSWGNRG